MFIKMSVLLLLFVASLKLCSSQEVPVYIRIRDCFGKVSPMVCLKEEALDVLNATMLSDTPLTLFNTFDVVKDPTYSPNITEEILPEDISERNSKLNELLYNKVEEFIESRSIKLNLGNVIEGRKKKGGKMGMAVMGGIAMAKMMMAHLFMGKIAFIAGSALIIAKLALFLAAIVGLKKKDSDKGETQHVVYTASRGDDYGHSHGGGGGWHRSLLSDDNAQNIVYRAHITPDNNFAYKK